MTDDQMFSLLLRIMLGERWSTLLVRFGLLFNRVSADEKAVVTV